MGDVAGDAPLLTDVVAELSGHGVDGGGQFTEFVAPGGGEADIEAAGGDAAGGVVEAADGAGDAADDREPDEGGEEEAAGGKGGPGPRIEEEAAAGEGVRDDDEGEGAAGVAFTLGEAEMDARPVHGRGAGANHETGFGRGVRGRLRTGLAWRVGTIPGLRRGRRARGRGSIAGTAFVDEAGADVAGNLEGGTEALEAVAAEQGEG